ncbi:MAG: PilT/PilU family type 4a pilus ATPase, partial [Planctomycetes bacterium]|nr:PilT/PilU family type 4a pilus ATPase [Planctomycetota bacterium]
PAPETEPAAATQLPAPAAIAPAATEPDAAPEAPAPLDLPPWLAGGADEPAAPAPPPWLLAASETSAPVSAPVPVALEAPTGAPTGAPAGAGPELPLLPPAPAGVELAAPNAAEAAVPVEASPFVDAAAPPPPWLLAGAERKERVVGAVIPLASPARPAAPAFAPFSTPASPGEGREESLSAALPPAAAAPPADLSAVSPFDDLLALEPAPGEPAAARAEGPAGAPSSFPGAPPPAPAPSPPPADEPLGVSMEEFGPLDEPTPEPATAAVPLAPPTPAAPAATAGLAPTPLPAPEAEPEPEPAVPAEAQPARGGGFLPTLGKITDALFGRKRETPAAATAPVPAPAAPEVDLDREAEAPATPAPPAPGPTPVSAPAPAPLGGRGDSGEYLVSSPSPEAAPFFPTIEEPSPVAAPPSNRPEKGPESADIDEMDLDDFGLIEIRDVGLEEGAAAPPPTEPTSAPPEFVTLTPAPAPAPAPAPPSAPAPAPVAFPTVPADAAADLPVWVAPMDEKEAAPPILSSIRPTSLAAPTDADRAKLIGILRGGRGAGASDVHIRSAVKPYLRLHGELTQIQHPALFPEEMERFAAAILPVEEQQRFLAGGDALVGFEHPDVGRFRVQVFRDRRGVGTVFHAIPARAPAAQELGLPAAVARLAALPQGLVLVTGGSGSGRSTTLAALVDQMNRERRGHVVTIEKPIEFIHTAKNCLISQREVGRHTASFAAGLRGAIQEAPDAVVLSEIPDQETAELALSAARGGILILAALPTRSALAGLRRLIDGFGAGRDAWARGQVSQALRAVVVQHLLPTKTGKRRALAAEVLLNTPEVCELIHGGRLEQIPQALRASAQTGSRALDDALLELVGAGQIAPEVAERLAEDKELFKLAARKR